MQDGKLTALLDWEFAHIGDPAEDLMYSRLFVEQVIDWPSFVKLYVGYGGVAPTPEQERFFAVWQSARNAAGCARAVSIFLAQPSADIKLAVSGLTFEPRFAIDALQRIVA
jgi:aminoglycoside phosphotransferase (APT) family kinase protein